MKEANYTGLSYSSASLLLNCEERYVHHKIKETPHDSDIKEDNDSLIFGTAFHTILEQTKHTSENIKEVFESVAAGYGFDSATRCLLEACIFSYLTKHKNNPYKVLACELEIKTEEFIGYVDAVAVNDVGEWIIVDLKTASRIFGQLDKKLPDDFQLNIYTYYRQQLADLLSLDVNKFMGCSYRVTVKGKIGLRSSPSESLLNVSPGYSEKLLKSCESHDYFIPFEDLSPEKFGQMHRVLHQKSLLLRNGKLDPTKNYGNCEAYFRPCPFWSNCHKFKYSDERSFKI